MLKYLLGTVKEMVWILVTLSKKSSIQVSIEQRLRIARDVARVFQFMHQLGIVHRDVKSHNVLVDENFNIKVCDFGLARFKVSFTCIS